MTTLDKVPEEEEPVHLLLVADSKAGKSTYAAQAAIDGFNMIYFDSDNGLSALRHALKAHPEAMKRVHYFNTNRPSTFLSGFLRSTEKVPFRWVPRLNKLWGKLITEVTPEDKVWVFDATKVPPSWLLSIDSWTSTSADSLGIGSADQAALLLEGTDQGIYGSANVSLTYISNMLQKFPSHVIVQAHGTKFEIYEKPTGKESSKIKQGEMILRDTVDVPVSSSRPHGMTMGSRFNHIGWLYVNRLGQTDIDFTRTSTRIGGGPPNRKAKVEELPFSKLVRSVPTPVEANGWFTETTHGALIEPKK